MTANTYCDESPYAGVELVAVGLVDGAEVITEVAVAVAPECDSIATCDEPATVNVADQDDNDATAQAACVAEAVRLTREAAQTWDDLTQESAAETECGR